MKRLYFLKHRETGGYLSSSTVYEDGEKFIKIGGWVNARPFTRPRDVYSAKESLGGDFDVIEFAIGEPKFVLTEVDSDLHIHTSASRS